MLVFQAATKNVSFFFSLALFCSFFFLFFLSFFFLFFSFLEVNGV